MSAVRLRFGGMGEPLTLEEKMADDGWTVECESPLEMRHIDGTFITGFVAEDLIELYKKGGRYGKQ